MLGRSMRWPSGRGSKPWIYTLTYASGEQSNHGFFFLTTEHNLYKQMRIVLFKILTLGSHTLIYTAANLSGTRLY